MNMIMGTDRHKIITILQIIIVLQAKGFSIIENHGMNIYRRNRADILEKKLIINEEIRFGLLISTSPFLKP